MALIAAVVLLAASAALAFQVLRVEPTPSWSGVLLGGPEIALTPRISPDGKTLAFLAMVNNLTQVAVMDPTNGNWTILTQDRSRGYPNQLAWSADGSRIYFHRVYGGSSSIYSIPALGGEERLVLEDAEAPLPLPDGSLIVRGFNERRVSELYRFWPENSRKELLGAVLGNFGTAGVSRDGKSVAFYGWLSESSQNQPRALYDGDIDSNKFRLIASYEQTQDTNRFFPITSDQQGNGWITSQLSGDLFQVVRIPSGGGTTHPLMILSQHSRTIDSAPDGSLYIDLWDRPNEIVRFGVEGGIPELLAFKPRFRRDDALATVLPDRRILFETEFAGRTRMAVIRPGERLFPFVETSEETFEPATVISDNEVACMIGSGENQTVAIVSTKNGQIVRRLKGTMGKQIGQIAASPDGKTLYFVESQSIWAIPVADGEPRKLSSGDGVAPSPDGRYLVIQKIEKDGIKLSKLLVTGGEPEAIAMNLGTLRLWGELTPNAVAPDGRIVVAVDSPDSWFESPAVIDPRTGQVEKVPITFGGDIHSPGWTKDGRITASRQPIRSSIWRFRPEK